MYFWSMLLCGLLGVDGSGALPAAVPTRPGRWLTRWEDGQAQARQTGQPIFVVFR